MEQAKKGHTVKVHYTGRLGDGTEFDTSVSRGPLQFKIGDGNIIPGFEQAVIGMEPGETKTATIPADQAYGPHYENLVLKLAQDQIPSNLEPEIGQQLEIRQESGEVIGVRVTHVSPSSVTLDANHPLAGEDLTFDIQLVEID